VDTDVSEEHAASNSATYALAMEGSPTDRGDDRVRMAYDSLLTIAFPHQPSVAYVSRQNGLSLSYFITRVSLPTFMPKKRLVDWNVGKYAGDRILTAPGMCGLGQSMHLLSMALV
jgi:hypothetical protein